MASPPGSSLSLVECAGKAQRGTWRMAHGAARMVWIGGLVRQRRRMFRRRSAGSAGGHGGTCGGRKGGRR
eukprot:2887238-Pyramimonas_sp.AAC.1